MEKLDSINGYDLIGDIHGCAKTLTALLDKLGYRKKDNIYKHENRKVIFLGDFIDRGPFQREVIAIVRPMIEAGAALSVMGNHEFNAISWATRTPDKTGYLRPHTEKNRNQHKVFLDAYKDNPEAYAETIAWFKILPLWLDLGDIRIIHACWDKNLIQQISKELKPDNTLTEELLVKVSQKGSWQYEAVETLLKGKEIPLQDGISFKDKDGNPRKHIRIRWWDSEARTYQKAFMGPESARTHIPDDEIKGDHLVEYGYDEPPVFLGHYWMEGDAAPLVANIACLDYSVAKQGGRLVAYRWSGEDSLNKENIVFVHRKESSTV